MPVRQIRIGLPWRSGQGRCGGRLYCSAHQKRQINGTKKTAMTKNHAMQTMPIFQ
jgi:hypothetical protein